MKGSFQAQQAAAVAVRIGVDVLQGGRCVGMPEESLNLGHFTAPARQFGCAGMPISYNKDKTRNPSKIKGFRACPYSFSKKNTLRSRSKGGVER